MFHRPNFSFLSYIALTVTHCGLNFRLTYEFNTSLFNTFGYRGMTCGLG